MSDEVSDFLRSVELLKERREEEDEARSRELEERILQEKRERQARRAGTQPIRCSDLTSHTHITIPPTTDHPPPPSELAQPTGRNSQLGPPLSCCCGISDLSTLGAL